MSGVQHISELPGYRPQGHSGAQNIRLVSRADNPNFEMIYGVLDPGGEAERHVHDDAYQAVYILEGKGLIQMADHAPQTCGAGSVIRIPPGVEHRASNVGDGPLAMIIVYSPPLEAGAQSPS